MSNGNQHPSPFNLNIKSPPRPPRAAEDDTEDTTHNNNIHHRGLFNSNVTNLHLRPDDDNGATTNLLTRLINSVRKPAPPAGVTPPGFSRRTPSPPPPRSPRRPPPPPRAPPTSPSQQLSPAEAVALAQLLLENTGFTVAPDADDTIANDVATDEAVPSNQTDDTLNNNNGILKQLLQQLSIAASNTNQPPSSSSPSKSPKTPFTPPSFASSNARTPNPTPKSNLFPNASLSPFKRLSSPGPSQSLLRLSKHDRGQPGSKEYNINCDKIIRGPKKEFCFDYVDVDVLTDPTKFNHDLVSSVTSYGASLTSLLNHCRKYDLLFPVEVPLSIDLDDGSVSPDSLNIILHHNRFNVDHINTWQFLINHHCRDPLDVDSDRILQDYFWNCLTGRLLNEVTMDFNDLETDIQGSATLIFMALSKLQSNSAACVVAQQGFIMWFDIASIPHEDVSLATTWLKATVKNLSYTNDIPNKALASIISGMARSHNRRFNTYCSVLEVQSSTLVPASHPGVDTSAEYCKVIHQNLDSLNSKYRELVQSGHWLKVKSSSTSTINLAQESPPPPKSPVHSPSRQYSEPRECFNPNCRSTDHIARDCPKPFPKNWKYNRSSSRGRSNERSSSRGQTRDNSRGRSRDTSRGRSDNSRGRSSSHDKRRLRDQTPDARKSALKNGGVSFSSSSRAYTATVDDYDADSVRSSYDDTYTSAFLLRGKDQLKD